MLNLGNVVHQKLVQVGVVPRLLSGQVMVMGFSSLVRTIGYSYLVQFSNTIRVARRNRARTTQVVRQTDHIAVSYCWRGSVQNVYSIGPCNVE